MPGEPFVHSGTLGVTGLNKSSDADFVAYFERFPESSAYVATDNAITQAQLVERLRFSDGGCRVSARPTFDARQEAQAPLRHTSIEAAVVDLFTCVQARAFKGTLGSSFSDAIHHLRQASGLGNPNDDHDVAAPREDSARQPIYLHSLQPPPDRRFLGVFI